MNSMTMFWRMAWKDLRIQRQTWLAILVLTPVVQVAYQAMMALEGAPTDPQGHIAVALVAAAVYMLGCGATLFSSEDESGTIDLLRSFPVSAGRVFLAKIALGLVSGIVLAIVLFVMAQVAFARGDFGDQLPRTVAAVCVGGVELFVWSLLFGFLTRHPLWAACLGVTVPSALLGSLYPAFGPDQSWSGEIFQNHVSYLEARSVVAMGLLIVNAWLARAWFTGRLEEWRGVLAWRKPAVASSWSPAAIAIDRWSPWRRHLWLTIRQGRWFIAALVAFHALALVLWLRQVNSARDANDPVLLFAPLYLTALLGGALGFGLDQFRGRFRFYAEQGVDARQVWWSRQLVWGGVLALSQLTLLIPAAVNRWAPAWQENWFFMAKLAFFSSIVLYAVGQAAAFFLRRLIVAAIVPWLALGPVMSWTTFILLSGVPAILGIAPLPLALLAVTWYYARPWYDERLDTRAKAQLGALVTSPFAVVVLLTCGYRAFELPDVDPGFSPAAFLHAGSRDGGQARNEFLAIAHSPDNEWREPARRAELIQRLDRLLENQTGPLCDWQQEINDIRWSSLETAIVGEARRLINGLLLASQEARTEGRWDESWSHLVRCLRIVRWLEDYASTETYVSAWRAETVVFREINHWAEAPGQTAEQLRKAADSLAVLEERLTGGVDSIKLSMVSSEGMINGSVDWPDSERHNVSSTLLRWLPSEKIRSRRLLHRYSWYSLDAQLRQLESLRLNRKTTPELGYGIPVAEADLQVAVRNTILPTPAQESAQVGWIHLDRIVRYRGTRAAILIAAQAVDSGHIAQSLDLRATDRPGRLPIDPVTGEPFVYLPASKQGPVLWSPGLHTGVSAKSRADGTYVFTRWNRASTEADALRTGNCFKIPYAAK